MSGVDLRVDLERLVHRELRRLPLPAAPHTLLPRVLDAVQAWTRRPWFARPWLTWPAVWQTVSLAALLAIVAGGVALTPSAQQWLLDAIAPRASGLTAAAATAVQRAETSVTAARVLWRALGEPLVPYAFAVVALMCLACAAFGTALNRVAFGRT